uniref:Structural protein n=1 Tax=Emberiza spodocephala parvoviridae sp. TaxID=2794481 RepID=A0A8A4XCD5_9VIRU|nr:MAG: structural protein [Emberiza spodocephala parvoviridae sp.]
MGNKYIYQIDCVFISMPLYPGHKYLGPGNSVNNGDPVDRDDLIAEEHDRAYADGETDSDVRAADRVAIGNFAEDYIHNFNPHSAVGGLGLAAKYIGESVLGVQYGSNAKTAPQRNNRDHPYYQPLLGRGYRAGDFSDSQSSGSSQESNPGRPQTVEAQIHEPPRPRINVLDNQQVVPPKRTAAEVGEASSSQVEEPPSKKSAFPPAYRAADLLNNFQDTQSSQVSSSMDMDQSGGDAMKSMRAGSGPGMGSSGAAAISAPSTINCPKDHGIPFKHTFHKSYRWVVPACLTTQTDQLHATTGNLQGYSGRYIKIGSSVAFDMAQVFQYLSPGEYLYFCTNASKFIAKSGNLDVYTLGVRAPYSTNTSNIEVANANLQAQIMDLTPIQHDFPVQNLADDNYVEKITGNQHTNVTPGETSAKFENISARLETRVLRQRAVVADYMTVNTTGVQDTPWAISLRNAPMSDFSVLPYIRKSINGSNMLGHAFNHKVEFNGLQNYMVGDERTRLTIEGDGSGTIPLARTLQHAEVQIPQNPMSQPGGNSVHHKPAGFLEYEYATMIGYNHKERMENPKERYAIYAIYNIRNIMNDLENDTGNEAYNSIVDLNWEIITTFSGTFEGEIYTPMYYGLSGYNPGYRFHIDEVRTVTGDPRRVLRPLHTHLLPNLASVDAVLLTEGNYSRPKDKNTAT